MKRIKVLALVMIFAFAALGGAYATLWSDIVSLQTNVTNGNVDLIWGDVGTSDAGDDYHAGSPLDLRDGEDSVAYYDAHNAVSPVANDQPYAPGIRRNVGHIAVTSLSENKKDLVVDITNAYPDYQGEIEAYIINDGTVPVVLDKITITDKDGIALPEWLTCNITKIEGTQTYEQAQSVQTVPVLGTLLEASNSDGSAHPTNDTTATAASNKVKVKISVHIAGATNMDVPEDATASLKISINGTQFNGVNVHSAVQESGFSKYLPTIDLPNSIVKRFD